MSKWITYGLDMVNKIIWYTVGLTILVLVMAVFILINTDTKLMNFIDNVRYEGYLTEGMYREFIDSLWFNYLETDIRVIKNDLENADTIIEKENIFNEIETEEIAKFNVGDTIKVRIKCKLFIIKLTIEKGGRIFNEKYH